MPPQAAVAGRISRPAGQARPGCRFPSSRICAAGAFWQWALQSATSPRPRPSPSPQRC